MTASNYDAALKRVLAHEGGYANHPADPGGATMKGVTQRVYDAYRDRHGMERKAVRGISAAEIAAIYRTQYADKIAFDKLPTGIDYVVFDGAANSGPAQSVKWLQRALGVTADGIIGNVTLSAAAKAPAAMLIDNICEQRMRFLKALKTWKTFGKGWSARVSEVRSGAKRMIGGTSPVPSVSTESGAKASASDVAAPAAPIGGPTAGAASGAVAVALETARQQIEPYAGTSTVNMILVGLTILATAIAVGGVVYGLYAKAKAAKAKAAVGSVT
ncbi:glycoside hydrolase family 108 protein [Aureimonas glaciei]|uniref:Secretion activator protein n=1 Tax=Aureimonas glaciei TaxID=1776957 RepID=A0A917DE68_9HYPH|nr:glycoside hydrolase family 108 protein [Aureimonas glaciei]GGD30650.1 hypothetical protein GCM10011335_37130 [Aureimonas glaciei]